MTFYIGLDPGAAGAMIVINDKGLVAAFPFKKGMAEPILFLQKYAAQCVAAVEDVHGYQGAGSSSSFSFGRNTGYLHGMLEMAGVSYIKVQPKLWQQTVTVPPIKVRADRRDSTLVKSRLRKENKDNLKLESVRAANEHLVGLNTLDHNVADAANLAVYLRYIKRIYKQ